MYLIGRLVLALPVRFDSPTTNRQANGLPSKSSKKALFNDHPEFLKEVQGKIALIPFFDHTCILTFHGVYESEHHSFIVEGYAPNGSLCDCIQSLPRHVALSFLARSSTASTICISTVSTTGT
jgi:hypothetical protein